MIHPLLAPWHGSEVLALHEQGVHSGWVFRSPASLPEDRPWLDWLASRPERPRWFIGEGDGSFRLGLGAWLATDPRGPGAPAGGLVHWPCWAGEPAAATDPEWAPLARPCLVVPRFLLEAAAGEVRIEWRPCPVPRTADSARKALGDWLDPQPARLPADPCTPLGESRSTRADWNRGVARILEACDTGLVEKAVLGRWHEFELASAPDPLDLLRRLPVRQATRILLEQDGGPAFLALSPERLFRREGRVIRCDALAGTRPAAGRGAAELAASAKDRHEQAQVVLGLKQDLQRAGCVRIRETPAIADRTGSLVHLRSTVRAEWNPDTPPDDLGLIAALHPSPALGGWPREGARALLGRCEPFDRGLFGGLVGWMGGHGSVFHVGIRCARLQGNRLRFYAGAGIVPGSGAGAEWQETAHKLAVLRDALGLAPVRTGGGGGCE